MASGNCSPVKGPEYNWGDYTLIRRIGAGGMADVWQARRRGVEGIQKTVAIKKILSHFTGSSDFVTMFIDEAKLAAHLNHNNIIQIYDVGKVGEDFFIAMEYVDGMDLRTILTTARAKRRPLPKRLALMISSSVARALDYAHRKRDFDNRALGLLHRDVSPQNILISYEGEIKLGDFGIVKAVAKASTTQMGALKGKLQYMSPEQAWGKPVDARSDIFSLGSVLFEMLTDTRLFAGDSEIGVLDAVRECRVRSVRESAPDVPEVVDRIVRRALAQAPEERYQTAGELEEDLKSVIFTLKPLPSQSELATYMQAFSDAAKREPVAGNAAVSSPPASVLDKFQSHLVPVVETSTPSAATSADPGPAKKDSAPEPGIGQMAGGDGAGQKASVRDKVFFSYSREDRGWLDRFRKMLHPLMRTGKISIWDDSNIKAGAIWKDEIKQALASAKVAVLLVSPDFLASDFVANDELPPLFEAAQKEGVITIWVLLSACLFEQTPINDFQAAHNPDQPLDGLTPPEQNKIIVDVCRQILEATKA